MEPQQLGVCVIVINSGSFDAHGDINNLTKEKVEIALKRGLLYQKTGRPYLYILPYKPLSTNGLLGLGEAIRLSIITRDSHCRDILIMESMRNLFYRNELISYLQQCNFKIVDSIVIV